MNYYLMTPALGIVTRKGNIPVLSYANDPKAVLFDDLEKAKITAKKVLIHNGLKIINIYDDDTNLRVDTVDIRE